MIVLDCSFEYTLTHEGVHFICTQCGYHYPAWLDFSDRGMTPHNSYSDEYVRRNTKRLIAIKKKQIEIEHNGECRERLDWFFNEYDNTIVGGGLNGNDYLIEVPSSVGWFMNQAGAD